MRKELLRIAFATVVLLLYFELVEFLNLRYEVDHLLMYLYLFAYLFALIVHGSSRMLWQWLLNCTSQPVKTTIIMTLTFSLIHVYTFHKTGDIDMAAPFIYMLHVTFAAFVFIGVLAFEWIWSKREKKEGG